MLAERQMEHRKQGEKAFVMYCSSSFKKAAATVRNSHFMNQSLFLFRAGN